MLTEKLGLPRLGVSLPVLVVLLVDALGTGLFAPFSLLYFHVAVGLPLPAVGLALSVATAATLPVAPLTGSLVDRFGARRVVIFAQLSQGAGFIAYLFVGSVPALVPSALLVAVGQRMFWSALFTLLAEISAPGERDRWYGLAGATQNAGFGAGGLLSGLAVAAGGLAGYYLVVAANAASFLLAAGLLLFRVPARAGAGRHGGDGYSVVLRDRPFLGLTAANAAFALCNVMLVIGMPVFVIESLGAPAWLPGVLLASNTALVAGAQTVAVRAVEPHRRTRALALAALLWCGWCTATALAFSVPASLLVPYLLLAIGVFTLAELIHAPTSNALAAAAGPVALRGRYLATFQFSWATASFVAPGLFTLLFAVGPALPWVVVGTLALLAGSSVLRLEGRLPPGAVRVASKGAPSPAIRSDEP
jgi:Na+/melibiose symporter-like transporter